jgi:hypothetical protein
MMLFLKEFSSGPGRLIRLMTLLARQGRRHDCQVYIVRKVPPGLRATFLDPDGLRLDTKRRYWIERKVMERSISDIQEDSGQIGTSVEILIKMTHKNLTNAEEYIK